MLSPPVGARAAAAAAARRGRGGDLFARPRGGRDSGVPSRWRGDGVLSRRRAFGSVDGADVAASWLAVGDERYLIVARSSKGSCGVAFRPPYAR
eukprot:11494813-Alexandrium_andersonii.AAC.1